MVPITRLCAGEALVKAGWGGGGPIINQPKDVGADVGHRYFLIAGSGGV